ncbi:MAG: tetratricopeptide repeat protein [Elusimicrobia bacterium]|nr:tetratricopeptide repeat protein [Candidatus Obscuribacterium magneticum]
MSKRFQRSEPSSAPQKGALLEKLPRWTLALLQVVCPLLFFTNLTRNPYFTQIALLNVLIALIGFLWALDCWKKAEWRLPRLPFEIPLVIFLAVALLSTVHSWKVYSLLRSGIIFEGIRIWVFTLVNSVMAFYLPLLFSEPLSKYQRPISIWSDIVMAGLWGALWLGFSSMKSLDPNATLWDPYGAILWGLAMIYALVRVKRGNAIEFFHVIFAVSLIAGAYGILQYSGRDAIWTSLIQPYGGRPVSTFGNPNFLSSYLMLAGILALAFAFRAKGGEATGYFLVAMVNAVSVLCTLTRSTYVGLLAGYVALAVLLFKRENIKYVKGAAVVAGVVILLILIFPRTPVSAIQSPLARFTEIFDAMKTGASYGPWHQRILIWSSAWNMVLERPWIGKGWGLFELFFPFYQGKFIMVPGYAGWRTHANNAHNILLEFWSQMGLVGTGIALWLMVTMLWGGWALFKSEREEGEKIVLAGLWAGLVAMLVDNFFGNVSIFFAVPAFLFWWNLGALYNESPVPVIIRKPVSPIIGRPLLVLIMTFCVCVSVYYFDRWKQEVNYFQGFKMSKIDLIPESIKSLEKAYAWFPGEVNSNYELGNSYSRQAKLLSDKGLTEEAKRFTDKAVWAYKASLKANPGYDEIYFNVGVTFMQGGQMDEAERYMEIALFINPLLREAYGSLGNIYLNKGKLQEAKRVLEQSVLVFPKDKDLWNNLGVIYNRLGEDEKSIETYKKAVEIDPGYAQGWRNLLTISTKLGRKEPVLEVPDLIKRMETSLSQKNYPEAKKAAERIVELIPNNADAHLSLGNILFYLGQLDAGIQELETALKLKPGFAVAHVNLGHIFQYKKDFKSARSHFQEALRFDPQNADAKQALTSLPAI